MLVLGHFSQKLFILISLSLVGVGCTIDFNNKQKTLKTGPIANFSFISIEPTQGDFQGGTLVTLTGSGFSSTETYSVQIGNSICASPTLLSSTQLLCKTSAHDLGTVSVVISNSAQQATVIPNSYSYVKTPAAPTGISLITPSSSPNQNSTPTFRVSGTIAGNKIQIFTSRTCSPSSLKSTVTATGNTTDLTSAALTDGTYTFYANQTDSQGFTSNCSTVFATYIRDTAPPEFSITTPVNGGYSNTLNYTNFPIQGTCSENGRTVSITASDGTATPPVTALAVCHPSNTPRWATTIDLSSLGINVTITATFDDAAGNTVTKTVTITQDLIVPTVSNVTVHSGLEVDVTFSESMGTGVLTPGNYILSDSGQGSLADHPNTVTYTGGTTYRLTWNSGTMFNGGDIKITVTSAQDLAGNPINSSGTATGEAIATRPGTPSGITLVIPTSSPGNIKSPTLRVTGVSSGNSVGLYTDSTCNLLGLKGSGPATGTSVDLSPSSELADGTYTFYAAQTDAAGNTSDCSTSNVTYTLDTVLPSVEITTPSSGGYIKASNVTSFTVSGNCSEDGQPVTVRATDSTNNTITSASTPNCDTSATPQWTRTLDLSALAEASVTFTATHVDAAGNSKTSDPVVVTKDTVKPTLTMDTPTNGLILYSGAWSSVVISGSCSENGKWVFLDVRGQSRSKICDVSSTPNWSITEDLTSAYSGAITISAVQADTAGNVSATATRTIYKDDSPPVIKFDGGQSRNQTYRSDGSSPMGQGGLMNLYVWAEDGAMGATKLDSTFTSCTYQTLGLPASDPNYSAGADCNTLPSLNTSSSPTAIKYLTTASWDPGTASSGITEGLLKWIPTTTQRGTYQFTFTATDGYNSNSMSAFVTVAENYDEGYLITAWDAQYATDTTDLADTPAAPNSLSAGLASWLDLYTVFDATLSGFTTANPWRGSGTYSNPYALAFNGVNDTANFGTALNGQARTRIEAWLAPQSSTTGGSVIWDNGSGTNVTQNGMLLRQSTVQPGKVDFVVGRQTASLPANYNSWILSDTPLIYWILNETGGATAADSSGNNNTGTFQGGKTLSSTGITFNGSTGYLSSALTYNNPQTFSIEVWFKTSTTNGGLLIGFGDNQTGQQFSFDRHIYMSNSGQVYFGIFNSGNQSIGTTSSYNDNTWHHAVATLSVATGSALYIDGKLQAFNTSMNAAQNYTGYWRLGYTGDFPTTSYTNKPTSPYFSGTLSRAAVYGSVLTDKQIYSHYIESTNPWPSPYYPGNAVLADAPLAYWRLGEKSGIVANDFSRSGNTGTYQGTVALSQSGSILDDLDTAASFDGNTGYVSTTTSSSSTLPLSLEVWFKTNTTSGGKIIGFENTQTGVSSTYDRHIYMDDSGHIYFGINDGAARTITASGAYNDQTWHHVVATFSARGIKLYVDGALASSNPSYTTNTSYSGYLRVGGGTLSATWPSNPTSAFFNGVIDEVAVYGYELSSTQVAQHYNSSQGLPWSYCLSQSTFNNNEWNMISTLFNQTDLKLFVNGQQECSLSWSGSYSGDVSNLIGGSSFNLTQFWQGLIADLRVFASTGSDPGSSSNIAGDFAAIANRFRKTPVEDIVKNGLILHLDAANAKRGLSFYPNGCSTTDLNWFDFSGSVLNGSLIGFSGCGSSSGWTGNGNSGTPYALTFDGVDDYVRLPMITAPVSLGGATFEVWAKPTTGNASQKYLVIGEGPSNNNIWLGWDSSGNYYETQAYNYGTPGTPVTASTPVALNVWQHVVTTITASGDVIMYVNGSQIASGATGAGLVSSYRNQNFIGKGSEPTDAFYSGSISVVRMYYGILSPQQISQNCHAQKNRFGVTCTTP